MAYLRSCQEVTEQEADHRKLIQEKQQAEEAVAKINGKIVQSEIELNRRKQKFSRLRIAYSKTMKFTPSKSNVLASPEPSKAKRNLYVDEFDGDDNLEMEMLKLVDKVEGKGDDQKNQKGSADPVSFDDAMNLLESSN